MIMQDLGAKKREFNRHLINWEKKEGRHFHWRKRRDPYKVFVAEFLLKRTTSTAAHKIFQKFLEKYPNLFVLSSADNSELENELRPIGLYKQRAKGMKEATTYLVKSCNGKFPKKYDELMKIPHVGSYSAACILSFGMNIPAPAIDSNGQRILSRVFKNTLEKNMSLKKILDFSWGIVPHKDHVLFNYGLIDMGALICTYRGCSRERCPLNNICDSVLIKG
jgi:A/G-specific adenine glycosylase